MVERVAPHPRPLRDISGRGEIQKLESKKHMISASIPLEKWQPLSVKEVCDLFDGAPFQWALAGGYAIELFLGKAIRSHSDIDVILYRDEQLKAQRWLKEWRLYAADPPGTLRPWNENEFLAAGIDDIWLHHSTSEAWQLQFLVSEVEGDEWVSKRNPLIRGQRNTLITRYQDVPCIRAEIQLLYKAKNRRPKDELDFQACLPLLSIEAKQWLKQSLVILYPEGHAWLSFLEII